MKESILGIDIGTSSIKCSLFDFNGRELLRSSSDYQNIYKDPGIVEIDNEVLWGAVVKAIKEIVNLCSGKYKIISVGICAIMIMPVLLDSKNNVIRPIIHWFDSRPRQQYYEIKQKGLDKLISEFSGSAFTGESTINTLSWVKTFEPGNYKKISKFILLKDYIRFKLTGKILSDFGDASGSQMLDTRKWKWCNELIEELGFKKHIFPDLFKPYENAGNISSGAAGLTGLEPGTPVAVGSGDGITTIFGLGIYREGQVGVTVGSAGVIAAPSRTYPEDDKYRGYIFCHPMCDRWFTLMATASSGAILKWYLENLVNDKEITYRDLDIEAKKSPAGSNGLLFLPYLLGSRNPHSNPRASGTFLGLRYNHKRSDITRALLEGISFELLDIFHAEKEILLKRNITISKVKLSGGIINSNFWMQVLADILGKDIITTKVKELGTLGSSIIAAVTAGIYSDLETAVKKMVVDEKLIGRNSGLESLYRERFEIFKDLYKTLEPKFDLLLKQGF